MENVYVLDFLTSVRRLYALEYSNKFDFDYNLLFKLITNDNFDADINLGMVFIEKCGTSHEFIVVDGLRRLISVSLIIYSILNGCELLLKNSKLKPKILTEKLFYKSTPKLILNGTDDELYSKIINGIPLSFSEKDSPLFIAVNKFLTQIEENQLTIDKLYRQLQNLTITLFTIKKEDECETFYQLNKDKRRLSTVSMINFYMSLKKELAFISKLTNIFKGNQSDTEDFLTDYLITKTNNSEIKVEELFEYYKRYIETMTKYQPLDKILDDIIKFAVCYQKMINVDFNNIALRNQFIEIKVNKGRDAYPYLLELYGDYQDNNISEEIFIELLKTINKFLQDRNNSSRMADFSLVNLSQQLNKLISSQL